MAEALLINAAKVTLERLLPLATNSINNQINLAGGFKEDVKKLCKRLEIIQALLHDAEKKEITSATMMVWLKDLRAATCDAENVLDELAYEDLRRKVQNRKRDKVRDLFTLSDPVSFRVKMANKINNITKLLDQICKAANDIGLEPARQINDAIAKPRVPRTSLPFVDESEIFGRDSDVSAVVERLLSSVDIETHLPVTAIVGMPGLGKTALAQVVYKKVEDLNSFEQKMWISVSDDFKVERLLNEMVQSLTGEKSETPNIEGVVRKLGEKLKGKKYLLVLDDVWNNNQDLWVDLRNSLIGIGGSKESKILVTTRSMEVVSTMRTSPSLTHELTRLSEEYCWTMFRKRAFAHGGPRETPTLSDIGGRMVQKCKGVPLAINSLGGLLYSKQDEREWESIEESGTWSLLENEEGISSVLRLSFDHLTPPSLKQSFAICSIFPKGYQIVKDELIQLWMGLGYVKPSSRTNMEMEELGNEYFHTLLRNSLFQEVEFDEYDKITSCKMHDLVHDLALHVSQGSCLTLKDGEVIKNCPDVQHLSLFLAKETQLELPKENVEKLRAIFLEGHLPQNGKDLKCVRALRLKTYGPGEIRIGQEVQELPSSIGKSIHLRFLDLTWTRIKKVPNFVTKFYNLETLRLPNVVEELPEDFHNMVSMRHFYLEDRVRDEPMVEWRLPYLKGKDQHRKLMPMKIGLLKSLHTLPFFFVGKSSGHGIDELGNLSKLEGNLHVYDLQHVKGKEEAEKAQISGKSGIHELHFHWDEKLVESDNNHEDVLEGLKPHRTIMGLTLTCFGGRRWASWMSRDSDLLQKLVKVELIECRLCEQISPLGHLPHLEFVFMTGLDNLKRIGHEFYAQGEWIVDNSGISDAAALRAFPVLSEVKLHKMPQLEEWSDAMSMVDSFPRLKNISIFKCPKLTTIPAFKGSTSLQELSMKNCTELMGLPEGILQPTLVEVYIHGCPKLKTLSPIAETEAVSNGSTSLQRLTIWDCPELMCLPKGLLQPSLLGLTLEHCPKLEIANPDALRTLTSLKTLRVGFCPNWVRYLEGGLICTTSLRELDIGGLGEECRYFPWPSSSAASEPWGHFTSLEELSLYGWPEVKSLPDQLEHLPALGCLEIHNFSGLESLPEWLANPSSLDFLGISDCPLLKKRCEKGSGEDWRKIEHIPCILIDSRIVQ